MLRGRRLVTFYEYDDQGRVARSWTESEWTVEDRALMLARQMYLGTIHERCGHPKDRAFHPDNEGYFEVTDTFVCHACTAMDNHGHDYAHGPAKDYELMVVSDTRDYEKSPLPPIVRPGVSDEAMGGAA